MYPIQISPQQVLHEVTEFNRKVADGARQLADIDNEHGLTVGVTPKEAVYSEDKLVMYRFKSPFGEPRNPVPVLIVYALVNRPYMADLQQDRSMIQGLLRAGLDVYLIDWGYPDRADRFLTLSDYIDGYIDRCVDHIRASHDLEKINLLGICQGGTFSLCYAALNPEKVKNLTTMVTPVDFHTPDNLLSHWVRHLDVDLMVDTMGNIPGELLNWSFLSLRPYRLMGQKYMDMVDILDNEQQLHNFLRMEKWIFDSPDQTGEAFRQFIKEFYQQNALIKGGVSIGGTAVELKQVTMPVLNVYATEDHLVPPTASTALKEYVGSSDYQEVAFPGGHIGIYVSGKSQKQVPPSIGEWLDART